MTPERVSKRGSFRLERTFCGVSFRMATGLLTLPDYHDFLALCRKLERQHRREVFLALKDGRLTVADLMRADDMGVLDNVTTEVVLFRRLWDTETEKGALSAALKLVRGPHSRKRYAVSFAKLARLTLNGQPILSPNALVRDLALVPWDTIAASWMDSGSDWNHLGRALSACLTLLLGGKRKGRYHPFRIEVMDLFPRLEEVERVPNLTIPRWHELVAALPEHIRPAIYFLTLTGKRTGEYFRLTPEDLMHDVCKVHIPPVQGRRVKTSHQYVAVDPGMWPWIVAAVPSPVKQRWLGIHWRRACQAVGVEDVTIHDLRHCAAQWPVNAGLPITAVQAQLAHKDPRMTWRYAAQAMTADHAKIIAGLLAG